MNDEIKEILEIFKQVDLEPEAGGCYNCPKKDKDKTCIGCLNDAKDKLLDYITNLQQENERIKKMNMHEHKYGSDMEEKYLIEKTKNDRAVEYIEDKMELTKECPQDLLDILNGKE